MPRFRYALQAALSRVALLERAAGRRHQAARIALDAQTARLCAAERSSLDVARAFAGGSTAWHAQRCDLGLVLLERRRVELSLALDAARRDCAGARAALEALRARRRKLEAHRSKRLSEHLAACERLDTEECEEASLLRRGASAHAFERETA